jgi:hypothetical protein
MFYSFILRPFRASVCIFPKTHTYLGTDGYLAVEYRSTFGALSLISWLRTVGKHWVAGAQVGPWENQQPTTEWGANRLPWSHRTASRVHHCPLTVNNSSTSYTYTCMTYMSFLSLALSTSDTIGSWLMVIGIERNWLKSGVKKWYFRCSWDHAVHRGRQ